MAYSSILSKISLNFNRDRAAIFLSGGGGAKEECVDEICGVHAWYFFNFSEVMENVFIMIKLLFFSDIFSDVRLFETLHENLPVSYANRRRKLLRVRRQQSQLGGPLH